MAAIFDALLSQDPQPMVNWLESQFRVNVLDNRLMAISDMLESAFRVFCLYELRAILPAGWTIEHELEAQGGWRRADLLLTAPTGFCIMIELKYIPCKTVAYPGRAAHKWKRRLARGFLASEHAGDILDLEIYPYKSEKPMELRKWIEATEFTLDPKYDAVKHVATAEDHGADWSFVLVAVGARLATMEIEDD